MTDKELIKNFWQLDQATQAAIKAAHPVTTLRAYRVQGRISIGWYPESGGVSSVGRSVDHTVEAYSAEQAAEKIVNGYLVYYPTHFSAGWLNGGPEVQEVSGKFA